MSKQKCSFTRQVQLEHLERRNLLAALIEQEFILPAEQYATAVYRRAEFRQPVQFEIGLEFNRSESAITRFAETDLSPGASSEIQLPPGYSDAAVLEIFDEGMLLELDADLAFFADDGLQILAEDVSLIDATADLALVETASGTDLIQISNGQRITLDSANYFAQALVSALDETAGFLLIDAETPQAVLIEQNPLALGAVVDLQRPPALDTSEAFIASYLEAFSFYAAGEEQAKHLAVFEYVTESNDGLRLALGLADVSTGAFVAELGESYGLPLHVASGVIAVETPDDVELYVLSEHLAEILEISANTRTSVRNDILAANDVSALFGLTALSTDGHSHIALVLDAFSTEGDFNQRFFSAADPAPLQSPVFKYDVNMSGNVSALDALLVINYIARNRDAHFVMPWMESGPPFVDVNGDRLVSALDALLVINHIARTYAEEAEGESAVLMVAPSAHCLSWGCLDDFERERTYWQLLA